MRRAARTDENHAAIVAALRACGAQVLSLAAVGKGCPDLLIQFRGRLRLFEVKDGSKSPSRQRLTPQQEEFHADWLITTVRSVEEAIAALTPEPPNSRASLPEGGTAECPNESSHPAATAALRGFLEATPDPEGKDDRITLAAELLRKLER